MTAYAYYPTSVTWYYWDGDSWEDISEYVRTGARPSCSWGMKSNKYTERMASTGEMRLTLENTSGIFDPDDASCLTGWAINTPVKLVVSYDGVDYVRFRGKVDSIKLVNPTQYDFTAQVTIVDLMDSFYKFPMTEQSIETYKRGGEIAAEIVTATGVTPLATNYAVGDYEFPAAYDSVTTTTKAATELNKVALSENGYFYSRHDKVNGETLTFEAESTRNGLRTVSKLPVLAADCGDVLMAGSATDHVLMAGSATDKVVMNEVQDAHINGTAHGYTRTHGDNILNHVTVTAYPKRIDTTQQTIYSLGTPLKLAPGETKTINVKYKNASTKESCNAITELCSQPVATTDYLMNRNSAGTSTNLTSSLAVSVVFHTASADVTFTSSSSYTGYVTRLYLKGYGVYQDSPIKAEAEDSTSQTAYGERSLNIEQQYQRDAAMGEGLAAKIVALEKDPRTKLDKVTMIANTSSVHMLAFLAVDIGDMVKITESALNLADYFYVNGIEFSVAEGNVITYSWVLSEIAPAMSDIEINFPDSGLAYIEMSNTRKLVNQKNTTILMSINLVTDLTPSTRVIIELGENYFSGIRIDFLVSSGSYKLVVYRGATYTTTGGDVFDQGEDHRIGVSFNDQLGYFSVYIDGVLSAQHIIGKQADETQAHLRVGNVNAGAPANTSLKHLHWYNRILSQAEITADAASPGCITDGLVFSFPKVPTKVLASYDNLTLTSSTPVFDGSSGYPGKVTGSPVARLIP